MEMKKKKKKRRKKKRHASAINRTTAHNYGFEISY